VVPAAMSTRDEIHGLFDCGGEDYSPCKSWSDPYYAFIKF
jgi:hypothetical protein